MRIALWQILNVSTFLLPSVAMAQAQPFVVDRERESSYDMRVQVVDPPRSLVSLDGQSPPSFRLAHPATVTGVRVHVKAEPPQAPGTWSIRFATLAGDSVETAALADVGSDGYWSKWIRGRGAIVELIGTGATPPAVRVDRYAFDEAKSEAQSIHGDYDLWPIGDGRVSVDAKRRAGSVGRLRIMTVSGEALCSGFLVTPTLFVTNNHCVATQEEAASAVVDLGYDTYQPPAGQHRIKALGATDATLDFSVLRLSTRAEPAFGRLSLASAAVPDHQALWIIQHPAGEPKQISQKDCAVERSLINGSGHTATDFGHTCDTKGGSSGSPVLDTSGNVVGLHHLGFYGDSTTGVNQAVHMGLILQRLQTLAPAIYAEIVGNAGPGQE